MRTTTTFTLLTAFITVNQCTAQQQLAKKFTINGLLNTGHADSVACYYVDAAGKYAEIKQAVKGNKFTLTGNIKQPESARIMFKNAGEKVSPYDPEAKAREFYLEPAQLKLTGNPDKPGSLKLSGSKSQEEFALLEEKIRPIREEMKPIEEEFRKEKDHEKAAAIHDKFEPYQARIKKVTYQFFIDHPNSYVTLNNLRYFVSNMSIDSTKRVYNAFSEATKQTEIARDIAKNIKKIESGLPGAVAAPFTKTDINGKKLSLSDFKGKYVLLDFWASWCVPCRKSNPHMIDLYHKYKDQGLEIIGIADDDGKLDIWKNAVAKDGVGIWHNILRGLDWDKIRKQLPNPNDLDEQYGISSIPTKILIDPNGKIIGRFGDSFGGSEEEMDKMLAAVFKTAP